MMRVLLVAVVVVFNQSLEQKTKLLLAQLMFSRPLIITISSQCVFRPLRLVH